MKDIIIFGKMGSGKDTVADYLVEKYGYTKFALADNIKYEFETYFGREPTRGDRAKLIEIGQTYKKLYGEEIWANRLIADICLWRDSMLMFYECCCDVCTANRGSDKNYPVVITDGRFKVEYEAFVKERHYFPILVSTDIGKRIERLIDRDGLEFRPSLLHDPSETDLDGMEQYFYSLDNNGTKKELYDRIDIMMSLVK